MFMREKLLQKFKRREEGGNEKLKRPRIELGMDAEFLRTLKILKYATGTPWAKLITESARPVLEAQVTELKGSISPEEWKAHLKFALGEEA